MDSRNVNFSIKKSQIHTHMLGLSQKLTKLEMVLKTSVALDLGLVPKNWPWNELLFTLFTTKVPPGGHWWNRVFTQILHTKSWHTFKEKSLRISLTWPEFLIILNWKAHLLWPKRAQKSAQFFLPKKRHIFGKRRTIFDPSNSFYALIFLENVKFCIFSLHFMGFLQNFPP